MPDAVHDSDACTETFADRLRRLRVRQGLTQEALAERSGVSVATIAALEQGLRRRPYPHTLASLSQGLELAGAERAALYALGAAARIQEPPASADARPSADPPVAARVRLPTPPTELIGREADIAAVARLFRAPSSTRLITLIGPGGVGKTRLALAVAEELGACYRDGALFVDLTPLRDHRLIAGSIASALGVYELGGHPVSELVVGHLRRREALLVLDNFEQVLEGVGLIGELLSECPMVAVLATSRIALRLRAEVRFAVEPLGQPSDQVKSLEDIASSPAVRLFTQRAQAVAPTFSLGAGNAEAVAAICRRLDSIPLAIELAAARVSVLGVAGLLQRIDQRLPLLTRGSPDMPERQRTLRDTVAWSYELLGADERRLFRRLSVFTSSWTLAAAEAICAGDGLLPHQVMELLEALVDNSLVRSLAPDEDEPRFGMLEIVREYAAELAQECGDGPVLRARHRDWCLALAEQAAPELTGSRQADWLERLDRALDELRAALTWTFEQEQIEDGLRLAAALGRFWAMHRYVGEGRDWLERFLAVASTREVSAALHAQASYAAGVLASIQGDPMQAASRLEESIELYHRAGDRLGAVRALNTRGGVAFDQGRLAFAAALWAQCLAQARATGDLGEAGHAIGNLGEASFHMGDLAAAESAHTEALALARSAGSAYLEAMQLGNLGNIARERGDLRSAMALQCEALLMKQALGARRHIAISLENMASIAGAELRGQRAARLLAAASAVRELIGTPQPAPERTATERAVAPARAAVGEHEWQTAMQAGRAMALDQAIAYALEWT